MKIIEFDKDIQLIIKEIVLFKNINQKIKEKEIRDKVKESILNFLKEKQIKKPFKVICDETNNTKETLEQRSFVVDIISDKKRIRYTMTIENSFIEDIVNTK